MSTFDVDVQSPLGTYILQVVSSMVKASSFSKQTRSLVPRVI